MDEELEAMGQVSGALSALDQAARDRILDWAMKKFGSRSEAVGQPVIGGHVSVAGPKERLSEFGDLFHAVSPSGEKDKALAAAYWVQVVGGGDSFGSQALNTLLKDLGYGVSNITAALAQLQDEKPALVIQLKKSGTSQQARKTYKLTDAGRRRIEERLRGGLQNA